MTRKSKLTDAQWVEIERRHLLSGESVRSLAKEYGVDEAAIRRRINPQKSAGESAEKSLRDLALQQIKAENEIKDISAQISALPALRQQTFRDLRSILVSVSEHLGGAAVYGAATAHRLAGIAHMKASEVDDASPLMGEGSLEAIKGIAVLTKTANESAYLGIELLKANKGILESPDDLPGLQDPDEDV